MPNDKKHALRYLLLRFLWTYRKVVPENMYQEIANTLTVGETEKAFVVKWLRDGHDFQKNYKKDEFKFFIRGDNARQDTIRNIDPDCNTMLAQEFVIQALGLKELKHEINKESLFPKMLLNLCSYAICAVLIWLVGGQDFTMAVVGILIFFLFSVEFWYQKGKLFVPPLLAILIVIGFPYTVLTTAFVYSLFQLLDPNKSIRNISIIFSVAVLGYALFEVAYNGIVPFCDMWVPLVAVVGISAFLVRWTCGSHFRSFPLVFPFFCIGMYLDGQVLPAMIGLAWASIDAFLSHIGFHVFPVQRERSLIPNHDRRPEYDY